MESVQKVLPLLQNMGITAERSYYNIMHPLFMAPVDYRSFCRYVLPEVEPYVKILTENFDIQGYQPIPAQFQCYLTMPETAEADTQEQLFIEAQCSVSYGEQKFELFDDSEQHESLRDTASRFPTDSCPFKSAAICGVF